MARKSDRAKSLLLSRISTRALKKCKMNRFCCRFFLKTTEMRVCLITCIAACNYRDIIIFTTRRETCPSVTLNSLRIILQAEDAKCLGLHLDRRLNWRKHVFTKRKQLGEFNRAKRIGCTAANRNSRSKISCTRRSLKLCGLMASNCGARSPTWKC